MPCGAKKALLRPDTCITPITLQVGLLGPDGHDLQLRLQGSTEDLGTTTVLRVDAETNEFLFTGACAVNHNWHSTRVTP